MVAVVHVSVVAAARVVVAAALVTAVVFAVAVVDVAVDAPALHFSDVVAGVNSLLTA
jgi:hypothetical protein